MASLSLSGEVRALRLPVLLEEIRRGEICVPRFQRPFLWTDEQRRTLMDSIYRGYPIGGILVWHTERHKLRAYDHLGPWRLPEDTGQGGARRYLLDGHQRVATLFGALGPGLYRGRRGEEPALVSDDEEQRARWPIYFDLMSRDDEDDDAEPFRLRRRGEPPSSTWLPLEILFDAYALDEFLEKLRGSSYPRELSNRARAVADIFRDYTIPTMSMVSEDLGRVTKSFQRINAGGTPMSEVHMVHALTYSPSFDLLERIDELVAELAPSGWQEIDLQSILDACKLCLGFPLRGKHTEQIADRLRADPEILSRVKENLVNAAGVLHRCAAVDGPTALPYKLQMVVLADALGGVSKISHEVADKLRIWFWATTLGEYFSGVNPSSPEVAWRHLREAIHGAADAHPPGLPSVIEPVDRFDFRAPRARGLALLLAEQASTVRHGHVASPFETLAEHGNAALPRLVSERDVGVADRNLVHGIGNRFLLHPKDAGSLKERMLRCGLEHVERQGHVISAEAWEAFQRQDWPTFLRLRRASIEELERSRAEACGLFYRPRSAQSGA